MRKNTSSKTRVSIATKTSTLQAYYYLVKPGIIYGNSINVLAGLLFASKLHVYPTIMLATILGVAFVIGSACVFNNYIDRDIDRKMKRTKNRALVTGNITSGAALVYGAVLGLTGFGLLLRYTNTITVIAGLVGFIDYIVLYGWGKRHTIHGTFIGSISGATPIVAGYTAITNRVDAAAVILFAMLVYWQMAHFYAIGLYRHKDYAAAQLPILPLKKGFTRTKLYIVAYILLYAGAAALLTLLGYTGLTFLVVMVGICLWWAYKGIRLWSTDSTTWGKKMFGYSLVLTLVQAVMLVTGRLLR